MDLIYYGKCNSGNYEPLTFTENADLHLPLCPDKFIRFEKYDINKDIHAYVFLRYAWGLNISVAYVDLINKKIYITYLFNYDILALKRDNNDLDLTAFFCNSSQEMIWNSGVHFRSRNLMSIRCMVFEETKFDGYWKILSNVKNSFIELTPFVTLTGLLTTDELYAIKGDLPSTPTHSMYPEIRNKMDYTYFSKYNQLRQSIQDKIIYKYCPLIPKHSDNPSIVFTCGAMGAGKSYTMKYLSNNSKFPPINQYVYIDPDRIKYELPEMKRFIKICPDKAGFLLHKESVFVSLMIEYYYLSLSYNIIVDGSLQNSDWYIKHFDEIRNKYPNYTIGIIKISADLNIVKERCVRRGLITGRIIDPLLIEKIHNQVPISFEKLKNKANWYKEIVNNDVPVIVYEST